MQEVKKGINAVKAKLEYDKDIFEEVSEKDFNTINGWEGLQYNKNTNEFAMYKRAGTTSKEGVVEISLKVKKEAKANRTSFKVIDTTLSEGKEDIIIQNNENTKIELNIIEKQESGNNKPGESNPGESKPEENKPVEDVLPGKLPQTGENYAILFAALVVEILLSVNVIYFGRRVFKSKKQKMIIIIVLATILLIQFIGTVYGAVSYFSQKGELNGDGEVDYTDVNLLVTHLVHIKSLEEGKNEEEAKNVLQNADMNGDKKLQ